MIVDNIAYQEPSLVAGANREGYHLRHVAPSTFHAEVMDISMADDKGSCTCCGASLNVEVGNIFKLGEKYSSSMGATYLDSQGRPNKLVMGCYGIGVGRTIACVVEQHHDEKGIVWPMSIAPYQVHLVAIGRDNEVNAQAEALYKDFHQAGCEVLYDDRDLTPGVKFADADLLGMPIQVVVSKRSINAGGYEIRLRKDGFTHTLPKAAIISEVTALLIGQ